MDELHHYGIIDNMPLGQYAGELIGTLIESEPNYIHWMINNTQFRLDEEALDYLKECM